MGKLVHATAIKENVASGPRYWRCVLEMMMGCAAVDEAETVFADLKQRRIHDVMIHNSMINGHFILFTFQPMTPSPSQLCMFSYCRIREQWSCIASTRYFS